MERKDVLYGFDPFELIELWNLYLPSYITDDLETIEFTRLSEFLNSYVLCPLLLNKESKFTKQAVLDLRYFLSKLGKQEDYLANVWTVASKIKSDYELVRFCITNIKIMWS